MSGLWRVVLTFCSALFLIFAVVTGTFAAEPKRCFIGDSFTEGLEMYNSKFTDADFYGIRGISTSGILKKEIIDKSLLNKNYDEVYILLGINEVNNNDSGSFISNYNKIIKLTRELQPEASIYIQSIVHTTNNKSNNSKFKNEYINNYNYELNKLCEHYKINYIDLNPLYDNSQGEMLSFYSKDGLHLKPQYYYKWEDKILSK